MRSRDFILAAMIVLSPLGAKAADLVVWWEQGFYPQADEALVEIVAAFEQDSGKDVELVLHEQYAMADQVRTAFETGSWPDVMYSSLGDGTARWAYEDRLVDLKDVLSPSLDLFDADMLERNTFLNGRTGERGLYGLPIGRRSNHLHVWSSLLERAGFTLADIPKEWDAFWAFWCDQVQPAVRQALGRDDVWGIGLSMSPQVDTESQLEQFQLAYGAHWLDRDRQLQVDDPKIREGMTTALDAYVSIWRKGCTPPDAVNWTGADNNKAFLAQTVVMTANTTLSIPAALRTARPDDYYKNAATIEWPNDSHGQPLVIEAGSVQAVVFKAGRNPALAVEFVRFLAEEGWLAHYLDFAGDQWLPPMRELVEQPFWLDPGDPHRIRAAIQILTRAHQDNGSGIRDKEWRSGPIGEEEIWGKAVHRVAADSISPEQAVDEAIARIKQILSK